jgi:hypothetical protein
MKLPRPWQRAEHSQQPTVNPANASDAITQSQAGDRAALGPYLDQWAETVLKSSNRELLTGLQNAIVFGTKSMGRQAVMLRLANLVNARFNVDHHAAVYVEIEQMVSASTVYTWTSIDVIYRGVVSAALTWARTQLRIKEDRELHKFAEQFETLLNVPVSKLDMLAVRDTFLHWLDRMGIQNLSLFVDDVSSLAPEFIPVLLQMLLDTFPRGGRVSFKIGGVKQLLKLEERAKRGALGMQFSHDILVGLDLDQVLQAPDVAASQLDPRQVFLLACIQKLAPNLAGPLQQQADPEWDKLFEPADVWFTLYKAGDFDISIVATALANLLPTLAGPELVKADLARIEQAVERAKVQSGLHKSQPQTRQSTT